MITFKSFFFLNSYTLNTKDAMIKVNILYPPMKAHRVSTGISLLFL